MRSLMTETVEDGCLVLHLDGEFDLSTRAAVGVSCRRLARAPGGRRTVLDLTAVTFIDCGTIRQLARLASSRQASGDACTMLVSSPFLQRVIEVTGYSRCVPVVLMPSARGASPRIAGRRRGAGTPWQPPPRRP
ncbi:STAS domain-containing protein [Nocardioides sp. URHA0020]|uniref:STAS domain-containing protein n=1 Tax=Nocardioides sp. URHA0020 TaxID=1380392 RepID=UPI0009E050EC